jgi:hypothetical protein
VPSRHGGVGVTVGIDVPDYVPVARAPLATRDTGTTTVNVEPAPGVLATVTVPPRSGARPTSFRQRKVTPADTSASSSTIWRRVHEIEQIDGIATDARRGVLLLRRERPADLVRQHVRIAGDHVQRRAQLVRHSRNELRLETARAAEIGDEARVLEGDGHGVRDAECELALLGGKDARCAEFDVAVRRAFARVSCVSTEA